MTETGGAGRCESRSLVLSAVGQIGPCDGEGGARPKPAPATAVIRNVKIAIGRIGSAGEHFQARGPVQMPTGNQMEQQSDSGISGCASKGGKRQAFGQKLADNPVAAGANGEADGEFAGSRRTAGKNQASQIGAGDGEEQGDQHSVIEREVRIARRRERGKMSAGFDEMNQARTFVTVHVVCQIFRAGAPGRLNRASAARKVTPGARRTQHSKGRRSGRMKDIAVKLRRHTRIGSDRKKNIRGIAHRKNAGEVFRSNAGDGRAMSVDAQSGADGL